MSRVCGRVGFADDYGVRMHRVCGCLRMHRDWLPTAPRRGRCAPPARATAALTTACRRRWRAPPPPAAAPQPPCPQGGVAASPPVRPTQHVKPLVSH
eukprot:404215-Prorocentrum_minimum.AAC.3